LSEQEFRWFHDAISNRSTRHRACREVFCGAGFAGMFTPEWKKNAKHLCKGAAKFLNYKRDLLTEDRIAEIESRRKDLFQAIKDKNKERVEEASKQLRATCENSLPREKPQGWFEENVEVMFVAIVIALGLRAYYLQPFRIPTGSMQPTLNGITGTPLKQEDWPSFPKRVMEGILRGRSYEKVVNDKDRYVEIIGFDDGKPIGNVANYQWWHFFSRSQLISQNEKPLRLPCPSNQAHEIGLSDAYRVALQNGKVLKKGQVLMEGYIDTGDLVFVDKFSYHFRKPKRGEVFVFDTLGIKGIQEHSGPQGGGSHYIKRLVGVPGDELSIMEPDLIVNGKVAKEAGMRRVAEGAKPFKDEHKGYVTAHPGGSRKMYLVTPEDVLSLKDDTAKPGMREYAALGDNTSSSLDSRYWGSVKEYNLVGPALFSLWPITTGHWGFIK
jgi:signal peptidase I